jgi:hypothetical protein
MFATVGCSIPVLKLLGRQYGLVGVWMSLIFVQGVRAIGLSHRLWRDENSPLSLRRGGEEGKERRRKRREKKKEMEEVEEMCVEKAQV